MAWSRRVRNCVECNVNPIPWRANANADYCSNACRQSAYRKRKAARVTAIGVTRIAEAYLPDDATIAVRVELPPGLSDLTAAETNQLRQHVAERLIEAFAGSIGAAVLE